MQSYPKQNISLITSVIICVLMVAFSAESARAQAVKVQASVSSNRIGTEEAVTYSLLVEGSDGTNIAIPNAPPADGLTLLQSVPGTQQNVSIVNGQMTRSFGFTWTFRPTREGTVRIGAGTVTVGGQEHHTQPIDLTVVPQSQMPARRPSSDPLNRLFRSPFDAEPQEAPEPSENDIFIRAVPTARTAYQNEQVVVEYRLYFREGIQLRQSRLTDSWDAEGFWREELDVETRPIPRITVENGLRYNTIVLKRAAVFPTRAGEMSVDPLKIESEALLPFGSRDPFQSLFSLRTRFTPVQLESPEVKITARPLPTSAPTSFNGAVGTFAATVAPDRTNLEVGESLQLTITIAGKGNLATMESPAIHVPAAFDVYDPEVTSMLDRSGDELFGSKTFTYVLIPRSNGTYEIPPIEFTYFNTDTDRYQTRESSPIFVEVTGTASTPDVVVATTNGMPVDDFAPLFDTSGDWERTETRSLHILWWPYLLLILPLIALTGSIVYQNRVNRYRSDVRWARGRRAHPLSRKHLKQAMELLNDGDTRGYFEELERAVLGFVGNRMNVAERGLTREQLDDLLTTKNVGLGLRQRLRSLLDTCDKGRFAPASITPENKEEAFDEASSLIPDMDEQING